MAQKGLDQAFLHYGIRQTDLDVIEELAKEAGLNPDGVLDLLKKYHEKKVELGEVDEKDLKKMVNQALNSLMAE
jgi:protein-disulfide isomerase-like protein with CxxC motif